MKKEGDLRRRSGSLTRNFLVNMPLPTVTSAEIE